MEGRHPMNPRWTLMMLVAALVSICAYGCTPLAEKYPALTRAQLQHDVRLGRERENRFNTVYKDPEKYSRKERNLAVWNMPPLPVPKQCMAPHSAGKFPCMRYAARLHALPFFITSARIGEYGASAVPFPDGY